MPNCHKIKSVNTSVTPKPLPFTTLEEFYSKSIPFYESSTSNIIIIIKFNQPLVLITYDVLKCIYAPKCFFVDLMLISRSSPLSHHISRFIARLLDAFSCISPPKRMCLIANHQNCNCDFVVFLVCVCV